MIVNAWQGNDLLRGRSIRSSAVPIWDGILKAAQGRRGSEVLLVGMTAPGNFGPKEY